MSGAQTAAESGAAVTQEFNEFAALLEREFKPKSDRAREAVESAVQTLATIQSPPTARARRWRP